MTQKGQLIWRDSSTGGSWYGRFYATVDGERIRVCRCLGTTIKAVASRKLAHLIAQGETSSSQAARGETFAEAAARIVDQQQSAGMDTWQDRQKRLVRYALPKIGGMDPKDIRASHVRDILEAVRDLGKARQTMHHVKNDISSILGELWRSELLPENVCSRVRVPEALQEATARSKKERAVLTDDELAQYIAWVHPDERERMGVRERQTMACISRCFGGLRTSDLHALTWEGFSLPQVLDDGVTVGGFEAGIAPRVKGSRRAKGGRPQRLHVPEVIRPALLAWWDLAGRPPGGLVFPARRGPKAGAASKAGVSHANAFRRDLRRAFGVDAQKETVRTRSNGRPARFAEWVQVRPLTARERELFEETEFSLPVDFHSWRRAYNQALADAGVNAQQAQALAGHATLSAHERYLKNSGKTREVPEAALPRGHQLMGTLSASPQITTVHDQASGAEMNERKLPASLVREFLSRRSHVQIVSEAPEKRLVPRGRRDGWNGAGNLDASGIARQRHAAALALPTPRP